MRILPIIQCLILVYILLELKLFSISIISSIILCPLGKKVQSKQERRDNVIDPLNKCLKQSQLILSFHKETSHWMCSASQMTVFYLKNSNGPKWVNPFNTQAPPPPLPLYFDIFRVSVAIVDVFTVRKVFKYGIFLNNVFPYSLTIKTKSGVFIVNEQENTNQKNPVFGYFTK